MHDLGYFSFYLGMNIEHNLDLHMINIHQHSKILMILAKFRMDESRPVATPSVIKLLKRNPDKETSDPTIYQSIMGSLLYAMIATWPNFTHAIRLLSGYNHNPTN